MNWKYKAIFQKGLSGLPGGENLYFLIQRSLGNFRNFSVVNKMYDFKALYSSLINLNYLVENTTAVEVGTGWIPAIPIAFYLSGQQACHTFDIKRLLSYELTMKVVDQISSQADVIRDLLSICLNQNYEERLQSLRTVRDIPSLFQLMNLHYHAPADTKETGLGDNSIDIIYSNETMEHIPTKELFVIFRELKRLLKPDGVMVHLIDCGDHFSFTDEKISRINFLQYSKRDWRKYNNPLLYQNRLRAPQYREIIEECGFEILKWDPQISKNALGILDTFCIDEEFSKFSREDLAATNVIVVARPL